MDNYIAPLFIRFDESKLYIDLGAEKIIAAEKKGQKIAVERHQMFYERLTHV
ncbi:MAG: element excision factor XisH family protein [Pseudomonadota bacterium]